MNLAVFPALYLTWWYAPELDVLSDAALLFYGGSMLVAAARGIAGCEVLAVSNWLLRRDDEVGCAPFSPLDALETRHARRSVPITTVGMADEGGVATDPGLSEHGRGQGHAGRMPGAAWSGHPGPGAGG